MGSLRVLVPLVCVLAALPAFAQNLEPGEWEQQMTMTAPGMSGEPVKQTMRHCITSADVALLADHERYAKQVADSNPHMSCKVASAKQDGAVLTVALACDGDMQLTMRHELRGKTGVIDAESRIGGELHSKNHIVSKKVSDTCSPETIERWKQQNPGKTFEP
ncbi:MAG TPA: DUF3617 family protein [Myxococcota bacterium]